MRGPTTICGARASHKRNLIAVRGMHDQSGSGAHIYHKGHYATIHSSAPPPIEEYERWLSERSAGFDPLKGRRPPIAATKLRRMVVMRRQGSSLKECGDAVGLGFSQAKVWLDLLPEGLSA